MQKIDRTQWGEINQYLDEALELQGRTREAWLLDLDARAPDVSVVVRSLVEEKERLPDDLLLNVERAVAQPRNGLAGQRLGSYTLVSELGYGGMGTVWLARRSDGRYEGDVAVKLLNASLLGHPAEQRFVHEGSVLAKVRHPNIAQLIDAGVAPTGQPYLVLEYVDGERIDRFAAENDLDVRDRVCLFLDVLAAVSHSHSHLIIHRDLKPNNVLVTADGVVKLLDFGIATLLGPEDNELTREDVGLTPGYAAPEQLLHESVTTATDVYALGVMLFLLLAERHPLEPGSKSFREIARATLDREMPLLSGCAIDRSLARELRGDLDNIVARAVRRDPAERYATAEAFADDLRRFLAYEPVTARPYSLSYRAGRFVRRHRGSVAIGLTTLLMLIVAVAVTTLQMFEARRQRDAAIYESQRAEFQSRFAYQIMSEVGESGETITIRQLMAKGMEVLEKNYGDDPRFVIGMLVNISGRYMDLGDTNGEYTALVRAEQIARRLGDPERIAFVQCNTVETELAAGRPAQARERMQDGLAHLAMLSSVPFERESDCGAAQARLLWAEGKLPEAIDAATRIALQLEQRGQTGDLLYQTLATMLDAMLSAEGRRNEARAWNGKLIAELERSGGDTTMGMSSARHNQASHLYDAGEVREAFEVQRSLVDKLVAQQGIDSVAAGSAHRLGLYGILVEESDEGMKWIDLGLNAAIDQNDHRGQIGALLSRARAHLERGRPDRALADVQSAENLCHENPQENRVSLRSAKFLRAGVRVAQHLPEAAVAEIDAVLGEIGYPRQRVANQLAPMLTLKARAEFELGRFADALATARDALVVAEANAPQPDRSAHVGDALILIARTEQQLGELEDARAAAQRADAILSKAMGPGHSKVREANSLL